MPFRSIILVTVSQDIGRSQSNHRNTNQLSSKIKDFNRSKLCLLFLVCSVPSLLLKNDVIPLKFVLDHRISTYIECDA